MIVEIDCLGSPFYFSMPEFCHDYEVIDIYQPTPEQDNGLAFDYKTRTVYEKYTGKPVLREIGKPTLLDRMTGGSD